MEAQKISLFCMLYLHLSIFPVLLQAQVCTNNEVVIVMDTSGTISNEQFLKAKNLAMKIVSHLNLSPNSDSNRVALVSYADNATKRIFCEDYVSSDTVNAAIQNLGRINGKLTNTQAGLEAGFEVLNEKGCRGGSIGYRHSTLVLISDGRANRGKDLNGPNSTAAAIRGQNVRILAIGIGNVAKDELVGIAGSEDSVIHSYNELDDQFGKVLEKKLKSSFCQNTDPGTTPNIPCSCDFSDKKVLQVEPFTKYEIIRDYNGTCYVDKLESAIAHISERLYKLEDKLKNMENCKQSLAYEIEHRYNSDLYFNAYDVCTLNIACSVKEALWKLEQKKEYMMKELTIEKAGFGDMIVTGAASWFQANFPNLW